VRQAPAGNVPIHLRIPAWSAEARVTINGTPLEAVSEPGSYLKISRVWKAGDTVVLNVPMQLHAEGFADMPQVQALLIGPIVLAGQFPKGDIPAALMLENGPKVDKVPPVPIRPLVTHGQPLESVLAPVTGAPLTYVTSGQVQAITFKPLNQSWERYAVYWQTV
jgi:hypothetical protein